jgi:hypothetical protein
LTLILSHEDLRERRIKKAEKIGECGTERVVAAQQNPLADEPREQKSAAQKNMPAQAEAAPVSVRNYSNGL